ncbi:hypothetical protein QBC37DRAFT_404726 [Rhypophila decipiens]|uniref:Uncharacterized protein n=1 Tax=Rhypophila decipiens TaxID=261697 RepID=A0AAN7B1A2_9PEZI|nr:hypothetical protein QBC37DRAFT_404726 [Rhypophila decipiens]
MPRYLYQLQKSEYHYCVLVILPERDTSKRWRVTIGFRNRAEAQAFQGALLHHKVMTGSEMYIPDAKWTTTWQEKRRFRTTQRERIQQDRDLHFEFWGRDGPNYYISHQPSVPSTLQTRPTGKYTIIAIFRKRMTLLLLPLGNTNDKRFQHIVPDTIAVEYNQPYFKRFLLRSVNKQCRECQIGNKSCSHDATPWGDRSTFSTLDEPGIPLEFTLLNLGRTDQTEPRLQGMSKIHELLDAQFTLHPDRISQGTGSDAITGEMLGGLQAIVSTSDCSDLPRKYTVLGCNEGTLPRYRLNRRPAPAPMFT